MGGRETALPSLEKQYYRDAHLFVHVRQRVVILNSDAVYFDSNALPTIGAHAGESERDEARAVGGASPYLRMPGGLGAGGSHTLLPKGFLMKQNRWFKSISLIGAVTLLPAASFAGSESCSGYAPTFPSNYSQEAFKLLSSVRDDAQQVVDAVAELKTLVNDRDIDWSVHALVLARIQLKVNDMKERLCRLNVIQLVVIGWERRAIGELGPQVVAMSTDSNRALEHIKHHEGKLWSDSYWTSVRNIGNEAVAVKSSVDGGEQVWEFHTHEAEIEMNCGLTGK